MNVVKVSDELGRAVETYTLDLQDRPIEVTNVERQKMSCAYGYNDLDQLTAITWRDGSNNVLRSRSYSYTLAGMISRVDMEDGGRVEYTYDSLDRLTAEKRTDPYGQVLAWDLFEYDLAGNRTRKTILDAASNALMTVNYALSTGNRLASWAVQETNLMARFPVAGHASEPIGTNDRFGALWVSNATAGGMSAKPEVEGTNFWVYDFTVGLGTQQVVAAIRDVAGNMAYVTNTVIPSVLTNGAYQYNAAGCLTNMAYTGPGVGQTLRLTWDGQYQLTGVSTGAVVESYAYDALGRRVMTAAGGVTNWHVYDGAQVIADVNGTGAVLRTYVWGPGIDNLLAMTVYDGTTNTYYAIKDHLGSVLAMTDESGQIVEQYRYDAWGRVLGVFDANSQQLGNSSIGNRYLWQGREYSWATGLYNFRARWYDPVTGRWLSNDPIGISGGLNQYVFVENTPVNAVDPFGLDRWVIDNLHTYIVVEVHMQVKGLPAQVIGYKSINYSIRGVEVFWTTKPEEDAGNHSRRMKSSCDEDQVLLDSAEQLAKLPWYKLPFSLLFFNCRHFTASIRDVGMDAGFQSMWFPLLPPVLPELPNPNQ